MKRLILLALMLLSLATAHAVLKERDLGQTLDVLCTELTMTHNEQVQRMARFTELGRRYDKMMLQVMNRSHQIELMLYSQKSDYVFDLAYACSEATELHNQLASSMVPFEVFSKRYNDQVLQYVHLSKSLSEIPDYLLTNSEQRRMRDSCVVLADTIAHDMALQQVQIERTQERAKQVLIKVKEINTFAMQTYDDIRRSVFVNGDNSFFTILSTPSRFMRQGRIDFSSKYLSMGATRSEWRGNLVLFLFIFIVVYIVAAWLLSFVVIRFLMPKRWVTPGFKQKRTCIIIAVTALVFAVAMLVISLILTDHNFMIMASGLLSEYAWLLVAIMLSLIIRLHGEQVKHAMLLYTPITVVGLVVFIYRITFMPNTVVNLTFPIIMVLCTVWQGVVIMRHNHRMPRSDMFYTWFSLLVMLVALVMAWIGYTLMSVQVLIWWIIQLTLIQGITFIYDLLHRYEDKHISEDADIRSTWFYDAIYKMVIPIAATASVAMAIYWAAKVFDLTEWCKLMFTYRLVNLPDVVVISIDRLLVVVALGFVFNYLIYLCVKGYVLWTALRSGTSNKAVSLSMNLMKYLGWGVYIYIVMVILSVNRAGIALILTGLSTGIGFAMKDTLENLFYGLSLMNGRVKIGDMIECDGIRGRVKNINYQSTMVETLDGSVVAFLNSQLFSKNFKNVTQNHGYELAQVGVGVAYGSKINEVRQMIVDRLSTLDCYNKEKGIQVLFDNFGESSVDLNVVLWTPVATRLRDLALIKEEIYDVLNQNGIEIPFPQADVHLKAQQTPAV